MENNWNAPFSKSIFDAKNLCIAFFRILKVKFQKIMKASDRHTLKFQIIFIAIPLSLRVPSYCVKGVSQNN